MSIACLESLILESFHSVQHYYYLQFSPIIKTVKLLNFWPLSLYDIVPNFLDEFDDFFWIFLVSPTVFLFFCC